MGIPTVFDRIADIVGALDGYTKVIFLPVQDGYGRVEQVGIVRDLPVQSGNKRRVTMTNSGSEFFVDSEALERVGFSGIQVELDGTRIDLISN